MEDQQMVKAFLPHTPHKAFTDGVRSWRVIRRFENLNGTRGRHPSETGAKFTIVIPNHILRYLPIWRGFSKLLRNPGISGRSCHSRVDHAPRTEFDDDEREEWLKEEICNQQEVAGPDLCCVIAQKGRPLLSSWLVCAKLSHILLDGSLADTNAQFQEFPSNTLGTPESIFFAISLINAMVSVATLGL